MTDDRYGQDVLAGDWRARDRDGARARVQEHPAAVGEVLELADDGFVGAIVRVEAAAVELEDRHGRRRSFPLASPFLVDGRLVRLVPAAAAAAAGSRSGVGAGSGSGGAAAPRRRTASGSFAVADARARVARASRILVEGRHDAELVERVWGEDLRLEGVVVEYLEGVDLLNARLAEEPPGPQRRYGVLVDHLVPGSKEQRLAETILAGPHGDGVMIVGHPFVDIWQTVKPERLGLAAWPGIPRGQDWKRGICRALGWPSETQKDVAQAWQRILGTVRGYQDLDPVLLGRVEQLIDFVTEPGA